MMAQLEANERPAHKILSTLLAALLLLVAVAGQSWSVISPVAAKAATEQAGKKNAAAKDHSANKNTDEQTTVSALSLHAVVTPALSFDFAQSFFVSPQAYLSHFEIKSIIPLAARVPYYYFSYFRHLFGHHIAPNAP